MSEIDGLSGSVSVLKGPDVVVRASAGIADADSGAMCTPRTRFQVASLSKQFTAAAAMLLVEDSVLALDVPIPEWWHDCPAQWRGLTLHDLLSHTSGLGHWQALPGLGLEDLRDVGTFLDRFAAVALRSVPGEAWHYSSPGYLVVARIIEQATGRPYADFVTERILRPCGLEETSLGGTSPREAARGYRTGRRVDLVEFAALPGAADVWSTVGDLAAYTAAFNSGAVVTPASREKMITLRTAITDKWGSLGPVVADSYGYGYCLGTVAGRAAFFHPGDNPGYLSFLACLPELDVTVAILANEEDVSVSDILESVLPEVM
ncbi:serine hydrolase domain-containing protein [Streptomyces sp. NPDC059832]|uniref:serine hydrolase domain-containing protein n=1 Tax=Streptomyces sp. NPDC059832 TaxID=3346966 RepID=UPI003648DD7C